MKKWKFLLTGSAVFAFVLIMSGCSFSFNSQEQPNTEEGTVVADEIPVAPEDLIANDTEEVVVEEPEIEPEATTEDKEEGETDLEESKPDTSDELDESGAGEEEVDEDVEGEIDVDVNVEINGDSEYTESCDYENCFVDKFASCEPANAEAGIPGFASYYYEIIGPENGRCKMLTKYTENPNPDWINKAMTCLYDNSKSVEDAGAEIFDDLWMNKTNTFSCTGELSEILLAPFEE